MTSSVHPWSAATRSDSLGLSPFRGGLGCLETQRSIDIIVQVTLARWWLGAAALGYSQALLEALYLLVTREQAHLHGPGIISSHVTSVGGTKAHSCFI